MNNETTDKTIQDANILIPRVIHRDKITVTTSVTAGSLFYGQVAKTINNLNATDQFMVDAYLLNNNQLTKLNYMTMPNNKQTGYVTEDVYFYLDSDNGKFRVNFYRYSGTSGESRTIYFVVYSTNITKDSVL